MNIFQNTNAITAYLQTALQLKCFQLYIVSSMSGSADSVWGNGGRIQQSWQNP